jgi:hypothetical protein
MGYWNKPFKSFEQLPGNFLSSTALVALYPKSVSQVSWYRFLGKNTFPVAGDLRPAFYAYTLRSQLYVPISSVIHHSPFTIHDFRLLPRVPKYISIHLINTIELDVFLW